MTALLLGALGLTLSLIVPGPLARACWPDRALRPPAQASASKRFSRSARGIRGRRRSSKLRQTT